MLLFPPIVRQILLRIAKNLQYRLPISGAEVAETAAVMTISQHVVHLLDFVDQHRVVGSIGVGVFIGALRQTVAIGCMDTEIEVTHHSGATVITMYRIATRFSGAPRFAAHSLRRARRNEFTAFPLALAVVGR